MYYIKESYVICNKTQEFTYRLDLFYTKELIIHVKKITFLSEAEKRTDKINSSYHLQAMGYGGSRFNPGRWVQFYIQIWNQT